MLFTRPPPRDLMDRLVSLKVDNLSFQTTREDLRQEFEGWGAIGDVYIPRGRFIDEIRRYAYVRFYHRKDAENALDAMDGRMLDGRMLRVEMAHPRPSKPGGRSSSGCGYRRPRSRSRSRSRRRSYSRLRSRSCSDPKSSRRGRSRSKSRCFERSRSRQNGRRRNLSAQPIT